MAAIGAAEVQPGRFEITVMGEKYNQALEEGRLLLNEAEQFGIRPYISKRTGSLLTPNAVDRPYFVKKLREREYGVKLAIEERERERHSKRKS